MSHWLFIMFLEKYKRNAYGDDINFLVKDENVLQFCMQTMLCYWFETQMICNYLDKSSFVCQGKWSE